MMPIPPHIEAALREIGIVLPKPPLPVYEKAWRPEYKGQDPPF
jgi:hypothetical protein